MGLSLILDMLRLNGADARPLLSVTGSPSLV
jgi:hypothetical protein